MPDNGGVYFVPAFSGLYAPYWYVPYGHRVFYYSTLLCVLLCVFRLFVLELFSILLFVLPFFSFSPPLFLLHLLLLLCLRLLFSLTEPGCWFISSFITNIYYFIFYILHSSFLLFIPCFLFLLSVSLLLFSILLLIHFFYTCILLLRYWSDSIFLLITIPIPILGNPRETNSILIFYLILNVTISSLTFLTV